MARRLSPRQAACLELVCEGRTSAQIANALGLSARTVDQYVAQSCAKLKARNRAHAAAKALRLNLLGEPPLAGQARD
ncbi:LuxR C-terminal-related transcriptional regulator [Phenylobacterium sp.]|uniref:LuxR C-terminal-related transcriptional regulator n=1 Tax=Phenylobacterium sp. TaxID=1871053 RepID=UPI0035B0A871